MIAYYKGLGRVIYSAANASPRISSSSTTQENGVHSVE
jgi:hypothetical protein